MPPRHALRRALTVVAFSLFFFALVIVPLAMGETGSVPTPSERTALATPAHGFSPSPPTRTERWVVRAFFGDRRMVDELASWREPWEVNYDQGYLVLDVDQEETENLLERGFRIEIDEQRSSLLPRQAAPISGQILEIPGYPCYRTVEETFATAEAIVADHPDLATWIDIGDSWEKTQAGGNPGYDLMVLRLSNQNIAGPKPKLFIMTAVHAREYATAELGTRFAEYLVDNYASDPDVTWLLDYHEIHLLLQANPDGRKKAESGLLWRKNTNNNFCSDTDMRGVDLNRNFSFEWGCCGGSSGVQCNELYRGPSAASEPETQAIQNYIRAQFPDQREDDLSSAAPISSTGVYLDIHSYGELVLWPWAFSGTLPLIAPNSTALTTLGRKLAFSNQYSPEPAADHYQSDGISQDFAYGEMGIAAFSFEVGTEFFQACSVFEDTIFPDNLPSLIYAAKVARTPYLTPAGPDTLNPVIQPVIVAAGEAAQLAATIDDTRFNNQNGTEPTQNITAAEYYVDVPPWVTTGTPTPHAMTAVDGTFDETIEGVQAEIDTNGLAEGRHIVFVRGRDANGNWGPFSAEFLDVAIPPAAKFASNTPVALGTAATFNNLTTGTLPRDYHWDFGDGIGSSVQSDPSYTYSSAGNFTVTLRVTNSVGGDSISHPVLVCRPVEITNLASDSPVALGESAHFTATVSGDGPITYTWDFGDGTPPQSGVGLRHTVHTYGTSNIYDVTLDVTNACLLSDRSSLVVNVIGSRRLYLPVVVKLN